VRLGVDLDGVTVEFAAFADCWIRETFALQPVPMNRFNWFVQYPNGDRLWDAWWMACERKHLFAQMPAAQGAVPSLKKLISQGHEVAFITYRPEWAMNDTLGWVKARGLGMCDIHHVQDKSSVDADVYVDDHAPTVRHLNANGKQAFLFTQAWNADEYDLPITFSWRHFVKLIEEMK